MTEEYGYKLDEVPATFVPGDQIDDTFKSESIGLCNDYKSQHSFLMDNRSDIVYSRWSCAGLL